MNKYKKCISCRKKTPIQYCLSNNTKQFVICDSCLRIGMTSENGCNRLIELIRGESRNAKTKSYQTETI